jgi:hypothetical protein
MICQAEKVLTRLRDPFTPPSDFYFLPDGDELPVLVAARMSMSFPVLFSAVPLYTRSLANPSPANEGQLQRNLFSDGGIVSNFPIHLFDDWLPKRAVFGMNLEDMPQPAFTTGPRGPDEHRAREGANGPTSATGSTAPGVDSQGGGSRISRPRIRSNYLSLTPPTSPRARATDDDGAQRGLGGSEADEPEDVFLPKPGDPPGPVTWKPVEDIVGLLTTAFATARNSHDALQSSLPSYRERVVEIRFRPEEGSLNLAMPNRTIEQIMKRGRCAGRMLREDFVINEVTYIRFQMVMALIESQLAEIEAAYQDGPPLGGDGKRTYKELIEWYRARPGKVVPSWLDDPDLIVEKIKAVRKQFKGPDNERYVGMPPSQLRITPRQ